MGSRVKDPAALDRVQRAAAPPVSGRDNPHRQRVLLNAPRPHDESGGRSGG